MLKRLNFLKWHQEIAARTIELRKSWQRITPHFRSTHALKKSLNMQAEKYEREVNLALLEGRDEDASEAYDKLIAIKMQLVGFPPAYKK